MLCFSFVLVCPSELTCRGCADVAYSPFVCVVAGGRFCCPAHHAPLFPLPPLAEGGYGCVMSAIDVRTNRPVAIKRVDSVFQSLPMVLRILREVKFNRRLAGHPNLVALRDVVWPRDTSFKDVRMVFDSMPCDLDRFIESRRGVGIDEQVIKLLMLQLLQGLAYLHEARVMHRDLKPANVLIDETCRLKICDLGYGEVWGVSGRGG